MKTTVMKVTPELAALWLKNNDRNRRLNDRLVDTYVRDMAALNWQLNGEAIKISVNGEVLDGQHRLAAVVKSGMTVMMLVVEDLPNEVQATMDSGRKRSVSDALHIQGEAYYSNLAAVIRRAWQWDNGNTRFTSNPSPTASESHATLEKYPSLRRSAEIGHRVSMAFRPVTATTAGTAHHLFSQRDPDATALFMAQLETGADMSPGYPILALRDRFTNDKLLRKRVGIGEQMYAFIRTWNAIRDGETLTVIKVHEGYKQLSPK